MDRYFLQTLPADVQGVSQILTAVLRVLKARGIADNDIAILMMETAGERLRKVTEEVDELNKVRCGGANLQSYE